MRTAVSRSAEGQQARAETASPSPAVHPLAHLQRAAGNQALQRAMSTGAPLPRTLRASLESHFKTPLDRVRIHDDSASQTVAGALGARAFTVGQHIHLGPEGATASGSTRDELLAHEVVHTLQQGQVGPRAKLKAGTPGDSFERQADRAAASFVRGGAPERIESAGAPMIQCAKVSTHFGAFEDADYAFLRDSGGKNIGVEMYLKFYPGANTRADVIALVQATKGMKKGATVTTGVKGEHQATSGAGQGWFIDQNAGNANPLFAASKTLKQGGDPNKVTDFETEPVTKMTPKEQAADAAATGIYGRRYAGGGRHGYAKVDKGNFITQTAELYDSPQLDANYPNSSQVFETAALAVEGVQKNTYYGSVSWGWQTDAQGSMSKLPLSVVSQGVPSVNFRTAATIWNASKADFVFEVTTATSMLTRSFGYAPIKQLSAGDQVTPTDSDPETINNKPHTEVSLGSFTGFVDSAALKPLLKGTDTLDLPVPMVHTVSNPNGTTVLLSPTDAKQTLAVKQGTRILVTKCMARTANLPNHYEGRIVDGSPMGTLGYFPMPDLTLEKVGTR